MTAEGLIRVGLVGCGGFGRVHMRSLMANQRVQVVALCDPVKSHMAAYVR